MKKKIKVIVALLLSLTMVLSLNISVFAELDQIGEPTKDSIEDGIEEPIVEMKEEIEAPTVDIIEKDKQEDIEQDEVIEQEEVTEQDEDLEEEEVVEVEEETDQKDPENNENVEEDKVKDDDIKAQLEPIIEIQSIPVGLEAKVITYKDTYTNRDPIEYEIILKNSSEIGIDNIIINDSFGIYETLFIPSGEEEVILGTYTIPEFNLQEEIGNTIDISAFVGEENLKIDLSFMVEVEIPRGSITIEASALNSNDLDQEFDVFIMGGPDNSKYVLTLRDGESKSISNLLIGDYHISTIAPMNYSSHGDTYARITIEDLDVTATMGYTLENTRWFYSSDVAHIQGRLITPNSIDYSDNNLRLEFHENRVAGAYTNIDIEVLVYPTLPDIEKDPEEVKKPDLPIPDEVEDEKDDTEKPEEDEEEEEPNEADEPEDLKDKEVPEEPKVPVVPEEAVELQEPKEPEVALPTEQENDAEPEQ